jgi:hypothetical protein
MTLNEIKQKLIGLETLSFELQNGSKVPEHFHVTEVGVITKHFIDCGGTIINEKVANFQLWDANDFDHRLKPTKLLNIIKLSEEKLGMEDLEIEVEYQGNTIEKYGLEFNGKNFMLISKQTNCLAQDNCGIPPSKMKVKLSEISNNSCCTPGGGCC